jgi:hypothetical protein
MPINMLRFSIAVGLGLFLNSLIQVNQGHARLMCDRMERKLSTTILGKGPGRVFICSYHLCRHMVRVPGSGRDDVAHMGEKCREI